MELAAHVLSDIQMEYGLNIKNGSTLLRLALSNLVSNPPSAKDDPKIVISTKNDDALDAFLSAILKDMKNE